MHGADSTTSTQTNEDNETQLAGPHNTPTEPIEVRDENMPTTAELNGNLLATPIESIMIC